MGGTKCETKIEGASEITKDSLASDPMRFSRQIKKLTELTHGKGDIRPGIGKVL